MSGNYYGLAFFIIGTLIVGLSTWDKFNRPTFSDSETLPRTVDPLKYLFLKSAYRRARFTYLIVILGVYALLVWPAEIAVGLLPHTGVEQPLPAEVWALLVALFMVGAVAGPFKTLTFPEDRFRGLVHSWFLVPDGIKKTISLLGDVAYEVPAVQLDALPSSIRERVKSGLARPAYTLEHRWARVTALIELLGQMGSGTPHPFRKSAFDPFEEDYMEILESYERLAHEIAALPDDAGDSKREHVKALVNKLLRRTSAYISWGVWNQANNEGDLDRLLSSFGFRVPSDGGGRKLFDIVAPAALGVALITFCFWLTNDVASFALGLRAPETVGESVTLALSATVSAFCMYGGAVLIALGQRSKLIEQRTWYEGSPKSFVPMAVRAGILAWFVIVVTTVFPDITEMRAAYRELVDRVYSAGELGPGGRFLMGKLFAPMFWFLPGATVAIFIAVSVSGDLRSTTGADRRRDALYLGVLLGIMAGAANLIQNAILQQLQQRYSPFFLSVIVGFVGFLCGAVIGYLVPYACRASLMRPPGRVANTKLQDCVRRAEAIFGSRAAAESWMFTPHPEFDGITPAEAVQHKTHETGVLQLLALEVPCSSGEVRPNTTDRLKPFVLDGSRLR